MKKILFYLILSMTTLSALVVDNTTNWFFSRSCENTRNPYSTIQEAVNNAQDGDTIKICKGNYNEQVKVIQNNLIITNGADVSTPSDVNWYYNDDVLQIGDSSNNVQNLTVENISLHSTSISSNSKAIHMNYIGSNITLQNLLIKTDGADAIFGSSNVDSSLTGVFKNLTIQSGGSGIYINKGALQDFENINFTLSGVSATDYAIKLNSNVQDANHIFKDLSFSLKTQPAILLSSGKDITFEDVNITADGYGDSTKAIELDWNTVKGNLSLKGVNMNLNKGTGVSIAQAKDISVENVDINGSTNYSVYTDSGVTGNLAFKNSKFNINSNYGILIQQGKDVTINNVNINGSSGNGWGIKTNWNVVGNYDFNNTTVTSHVGGIDIAKGKQVSFSNVKVTSDSTSANDVGVIFNSSDFKNISIVNSELNATGDALRVSGSTNLTIDSSKLTTNGDHATYIKTNVKKATLKNSCFYDVSSSGNSHAISISNWNSNINISNNNCIYAPNGGMYASDVTSHNWDGNYWDGVTDSNGDGKISRDDTNYISQYIVDNAPQSTCPNSCGNGASTTPSPIANYQMDECSWDGTAGEVKDSSGNDYNGTEKQGANTDTNSSAGGGICHVGKFNGSDDYIEQNNIYDTLKGTSSLSFWIKTTQIGNGTIWQAPGIAGIEEAGGNDDIFWGWIDGSGHIGISAKSDNTDAKSTTVINDGSWHHIGLTRDSDTGLVQVYVDGALEDSATHPIGVIGNSFNRIGSIDDTGGTPTYFNGYLDEVKVYDRVLSSTDITHIYNNENNGKNYDGSERSCQSCGCSIDSSSFTITPLEFEGAEITLNKTTSSPHWTQVDFNKTFDSVPVIFILPEKAGAHPASVRLKNITTTGFKAVFTEPQGEDGPHTNQKINFLAINKGVHKIGDTYFQVKSISTKKMQQQGTSGTWEKVDTIFSSCQPAVVGQIQSLNSETGLDIPNSQKIIRSMPWMTTAIDVNSNGISIALERSETNEGSISQDETIGYMIAPPNIQDSIEDDNGNVILFETIVKQDYFVGWDDSCKEASFVNSYSNTPLIAANKNSRNETDGGWFRRCSLDKNKIGLQIDEDGSNSSKTKYNYASPPQDTERNHIAETGTIFAFSDTIVIHEPTQNKNYKFDAWDTFRDLDDRNISTKIVNKDFNLTIASLNESNDNYQEFNGTVCTQIDGTTTWSKSDFRDQNTTTASYNITSAMKDTNVTIVWKKDVDENCPLSNEDNSTNATDNLAIRPAKFSFSLPSAAYAGENFQINFNALDANDINASDYNETKENSFTIDTNITKTGCNIGTLQLADFSFINGNKQNVDANYTNIGDLNVTIREINGSEYAYTDRDDTNDSQRFITSYSNVLYIKPYELNVTAVEMNASTDTNWLYMANVNDMNLTLFATVQASNKQHQKLKDFNASCYAQDVNVTLHLTTLDANGSLDMNYSIIYGDFTDSNTTLADINKTITIKKDSFIAGEGNASYALNVDRNFSVPLDPFTIKDLNVSVTTTDISKEIHNQKNTNSFIFYYARVRANDITTQKTNVPHFAEIEVYDASGSNYMSTFHQNTLKWYRNEKHNSPLSDIIEINSTKSSTLHNTTIHISPSSTTNGKVDFDINNSTLGNYYMHIKTNEWLWYIPSAYGSEYNDTIGSNCTMHPCFNYTLKKNSSAHSIESGDFNGIDYKIPSRGKYKRTGIKIYR